MLGIESCWLFGQIYYSGFNLFMLKIFYITKYVEIPEQVVYEYFFMGFSKLFGLKCQKNEQYSGCGLILWISLVYFALFVLLQFTI